MISHDLRNLIPTKATTLQIENVIIKKSMDRLLLFQIAKIPFAMHTKKKVNMDAIKAPPPKR